MHTQQTRGTNGRPTTQEVTDPQAAREAAIKAVFKAQYRLLESLFPKDGKVMVDRACASAVTAARVINPTTNRPSLEKVAPEVIAEKAIACHHMGLELGEEAYLVPYGAGLQLIVGPKGLVKLMYRSGFVASVEYHDVFGEQDADGKPLEPGGDFFSYDLGDTPFIRHRKGLHGRRDLRITHVYGIIRTTTGGVVREVMTYEDVEYYRSFSKQKNGPAWTDNWAGMARKTLLHRLADVLPRSPVLSAALRQNEEGGVEIPEEIMKAVRARLVADTMAENGAGRGEGAPEHVTVNAVMAAPAAGREPGEDG